jgi:DNA (cytosine-5)-methyltransferase 1
VDRVAHGVPRSVVRAPLHALGNAVVPQVAEHLGRLILAADEGRAVA